MSDLLTWPLRAAVGTASFLIKRQTLKQHSGAKFASKKEYRHFLNASNKGLLMDGNSLRLSEPESFQNVCVIARVGAGKTSKYIVPNILDKAAQNCSVVVNDPKGECFEQTSQYMKDKGFNVLVINPEDLSRSSRFNPLWEARSGLELEQIAHILITAGNPNPRDPFWNQGAMRFVALFLKCLVNAADGNPEYFSLHNLFYLFQNFGTNGAALEEFMIRNTVFPDNPDDESLWHEWQGLLTGNEEGIQSFVMSAITALRALANPNIAQLTARSNISLSDLRRRKTIIYFITPAQHAEYYGFLTSIFFQSVFNTAMRNIPGRRDLPIYVLYDEFGHSSLPNFVAVANTIRGYKVSLSIVLQSIRQLDVRYGREYAQAIQGGFNTYVTFAGSDPETANFFQSVIGRVRERSRRSFDDLQERYQEYNLLNANEVRTIGQDQALIVSANRNPVLLNVVPFFANQRFQKAVRRGMLQLPQQNHLDSLEWVPLG